MPLSRPVKRLAWLAIPVALGAGTLYGVLARGGDRADQGRSAASDDPATLAAKGPRMAEAVQLTRGRGLDGMQRVVDAYAAWAGDEDALNARKFLLASLLKEDNVGKKLSGVLAAVEADPTPPEQDPLWAYLTESLSDLWEGERATHGMDLALAETRPRAKRAVISSLVHLATSERSKELSASQRQTLTETLIDVALQVPESQKPEVIASLRALGGNDLGDIVQGKGLTGDDGHVLESERAYAKSLEDTQRALAEGQPAAETP